MSKESDIEYKESVAAKLGQISQILGRITLGDLDTPIDMQSVHDDEFARVFCGLDIMANDLREARQFLEARNRVDRLRAECFRIAATQQHNEAQLLERLFCRVVTALKLDFAVFIDPQGAIVSAAGRLDSEAVDPHVIGSLARDEFEVLSAVETRRISMMLLSEQDLVLKRFMARSGIGSLATVCYRRKGVCCGLLLFASANESRVWAQGEHDLYHDIGFIAGTVAQQYESEAHQRDLNARLEIMVSERTAELEREKERLSVTLSSIADGVITTDCDGRITLINSTAGQILGVDSVQVLGKNLDTVLCIEEPEKLAVVQETGTLREQQVRLSGPGGRSRTIAFSRSVVKGVQGTQWGSVVVFREITRMLAMQEELWRARKLESVGVLAGGIAHDFNNFLAGIVANISLARDASGSSARELLAEAEKAAHRATLLTKQLLTFSRGGAPVKARTAVDELLRESIRFCLSGSSVVPTVAIEPGLWQAIVDKGQIEQVLNNLIINAVQAMPQGGRLRVRADNVLLVDQTSSALFAELKPGRYVKIAFADEGVGIDPRILDRVFDPYFTTKSKGSGLGLATAYAILSKHGGRITVESSVGVGSTFTIVLPAVTAIQSDSSDPVARVPFKGSGRVLVMDDEPVIRTVVGKMLTMAGFSVATAPCGESAVELFARAHGTPEAFSLVITDLTIPGGMGGRETLNQVKAINPQAKVIVFSGYSNDPIIANYREHGFDGVITKPFSLDEFARVINTTLGQNVGG